MKVCEKCGDEISTRDGDNRCRKCHNSKNKGARERRKERDEIMESMGLKKVKGALGGTYWE